MDLIFITNRNNLFFLRVSAFSFVNLFQIPAAAPLMMFNSHDLHVSAAKAPINFRKRATVTNVNLLSTIIETVLVDRLEEGCLPVLPR
jgi:hypothetical protein